MELSMDISAPCIPMVPVLRALTKNPLVTEANGVPRQCMHECTGGGFGIASLIGFFPEELLPLLKDELQKREAAAADAKKNLASRSN
jgi:hypothetical protein